MNCYKKLELESHVDINILKCEIDDAYFVEIVNRHGDKIVLSEECAKEFITILGSYCDCENE